jgi:hypothetical protein
LIAEPLLDPFPKLATDDRLVQSGMAFVLVPDLAQVDRVGEQVVQGSARKLFATDFDNPVWPTSMLTSVSCQLLLCADDQRCVPRFKFPFSRRR